MDHCIFWGLGFRQSSFCHVARVPQRIAPYTWTRPLVGCHAAFPLTFRRQVRHQTQEYPPNSSPLSRGYGEAPRGAPCYVPANPFGFRVSHQAQGLISPPFPPRCAGIQQSASWRTKGGKVVTIPLAPRTARAIDLALGERTDGPLFLAADGRRLDRHGAGRIVRTTARRAGIAKIVTPHTLRHAFITAALDAGVPLRDVQEASSHADPRTTMRCPSDRARGSLDRHATYIVAAYIAGAAR
jgi:hypothetical protein